jgi:hypothetical protein
MNAFERLLSVVFGLCLLGVSVHLLVLGEASLGWRLGGGAGLAALGGNLVYAAWRGRRSWLARIGQLP